MHRRSVFEPPKLKVDDPYYTFGTLEVLIFTKSDENTAPAMLLEPPWIPLDTPKDLRGDTVACNSILAEALLLQTSTSIELRPLG